MCTVGTERTPDKRKYYQSELAGMREGDGESSYQEVTLDCETHLVARGCWS